MIRPRRGFWLSFSGCLGAAAVLPAAAAQAPASPSARDLLSAFPRRTKITCSVHERTAPAPLDVEGRIEKLRRAAIRDKIRPEKAAERLQILKATWDKLRAGTDQEFQRVYYATPEGQLRLTEKGTYLANGDPFYKDEYQFGSDTCMINRKYGAAQLFPNQSVRRGMALENIFLWGIPLDQVVDLEQAKVVRSLGRWVLRSPVTKEYQRHHFQYANPEIELTFTNSRPWLPVGARLWKDGKLVEICAASSLLKFGAVTFPARFRFEALPHGRIIKEVVVHDVAVGPAVRNSDFLPVVDRKTTVLDGRHERTVTLSLKAGEAVPDRSVSRRIIDQSGVANVAQVRPSELLWYRLIALFLAVLGAYALLRRTNKAPSTRA